MIVTLSASGISFERMDGFWDAGVCICICRILIRIWDWLHCLFNKHDVRIIGICAAVTLALGSAFHVLVSCCTRESLQTVPDFLESRLTLGLDLLP